MTPLLGTKNPSAPVGDAPGGDKRASQVTAFQVFTRPETRDTGLPGAPRKPARIPRFSRNTRHESRDTAFIAVCARGAVPPETSVRSTAPAGKSLFSSSPLFAVVHDCSPLFGKKYCLEPVSPSPSTPTTRPVRFSRITKHESRNTAFMAARSLLSCALWRNGCAAMAWLWSGCGACGAAVARLWRWSGMGGRGAAWAAYCPRASVLAPSAVLGRPHDEPRSLGNPTKVRRIPFPPGKCAKRIVPQFPSPCGSPHCRERQMNPC